MTTSASPFTDQLGKGAWPIATFTYLLVYREQPDATKGDALLRFVWWAERPHFAPRNLLPPRRGRRHPSQHQSCHATKVLARAKNAASRLCAATHGRGIWSIAAARARMDHRAGGPATVRQRVVPAQASQILA